MPECILKTSMPLLTLPMHLLQPDLVSLGLFEANLSGAQRVAPFASGYFTNKKVESVDRNLSPIQIMFDSSQERDEFYNDLDEHILGIFNDVISQITQSEYNNSCINFDDIFDDTLIYARNT